MKHLQRIALYFFFFSINFEVWDPLHTNGAFSVSKLTGYIYLLMMIPMIMNFITSRENRSILKPIWLFFALLTIVSLFHVNSIYFNYFDFSIFQNLILFYILINHEHYDQLILEKGMFSFALGSVALALLFNIGIGIEYDIGGRVNIFGDNQNSVGMRMSISIVILILAVVQNRLQIGKIRYLLLLPIPIMMIFMAETGSRVALLSFLLVFITGIFLFKTKNVWGRIALLAAGSLALIYIWQFLMQSEILKLRLLQSTQEGDLSGRGIIWKTLIPLIKSNPIFGVGETGYQYFSQTAFGEIKSPHNVILEVLCYTGITGLILYLIFLFRIFLRSIQVYKSLNILLPLLLLIPVMGLLVSGQILYVKIGWIIFTYITGYSIVCQPQEQLK
jgi:O-antigen ligase